ncbi:hypothetical protein [Solidesulfovibrio sp. C21]|uniref:hypothetical protein n=1 Tax=Solidesulfovibrio sp. C21 TaxID=3398613 RepID=UPI0039FD38D0
MAKNAYTFAKRAKELAKKKKKEEKLQRKTERPSVEDGPYFDEATGEIIYPEPEPATDPASDKTPASEPDKPAS